MNLRAEMWIAFVSTGVALAATAIAWLSYLVQRRKPRIVAELLASKSTLDLVVSNFGIGIGYEVSFATERLPENALVCFKKSSLLTHGVSVFPPRREYRVPLLDLNDAFWGKGMELDRPLSLSIRFFASRRKILRRKRAEKFVLTLGGSADLATQGRRAEFIDW